MAQPQLVNGFPRQDELAPLTMQNLTAWDKIADEWETFHTPTIAANTKTTSFIKPNDGSDMFTQCLLPEVDLLAEWKLGDTVLDLGAGSGILGRMFARQGAYVTGLDFSEKMMERGKVRDEEEQLQGKISYHKIDLMDFEAMKSWVDDNQKQFDIITISTTLKSLPGLEPIARALPLMLKPGGRIVIVDLHPAFSKPAGHRGMEIYEDPRTGKQQLSTYIKVPQYLNIKPSKSEAVRGQPEPLWVFHRPFWALMEPFFANNLVLDKMREPAFNGDPDLKHAQSYHNFQQTPMLLAFRLRHRNQPSAK